MVDCWQELLPHILQKVFRTHSSQETFWTFLFVLLACLLLVSFGFCFGLVWSPCYRCCDKFRDDYDDDEENKSLKYMYAVSGKQCELSWRCGEDKTLRKAWYPNPALDFHPKNDKVTYMNVWNCAVETGSASFATQNRDSLNEETQRLLKLGLPTFANIMGVYRCKSGSNLILELNCDISKSLEEAHQKSRGHYVTEENVKYTYEGCAFYQINVPIWLCDKEQYKVLKEYLQLNQA